VAAAAPPAAVATAPSGGSGPIANGPYSGGLGIQDFVVRIVVRMNNGTGSGTVTNPRCGELPISLAVDTAGNVTGNMRYTVYSHCGSGTEARVTGKVDGNRMVLDVTALIGSGRGRVVLAPGMAGAAPSASTPSSSTPALAPPAAAPGSPGGEFDGVYTGGVAAQAVRQMNVRIAGTTGSGAVTNPGCGESTVALKIAANGDVSGSGDVIDLRCSKIPVSVRGKVGNRQLQITMSGPGITVSGTLKAQ
jgi:hypothetical protein